MRPNRSCHQRIHSEEKPYCCEQCGKSFSQSSSLKSHERSHMREKPYGCEQCGKCFSSLLNLKCHQSIHTGKRLTSVSNVGKAFIQSRSWRDTRGLTPEKDLTVVVPSLMSTTAAVVLCKPTCFHQLIVASLSLCLSLSLSFCRILAGCFELLLSKYYLSTRFSNHKCLCRLPHSKPTEERFNVCVCVCVCVTQWQQL